MIRSKVGLSVAQALAKCSQVVISSKKTLLLSAVLLPGMAFAGNFSQTVQNILNQNPQVLAQHYNTVAEQHQLSQAYDAYLPSLDLAADIGPEYSNNPATRAKGFGDGGSDTLIRRQAGLTLTEVLFNGGGRKARVNEQKAGLALSGAQLAEVKELVGFSTAEAYLNVLRVEKVVAIYQDSVNSHKNMLNRITQRTDGGAGRISEVQLAKSRLALAESNLKRSQGQLMQARNVYEQFVGSMPSKLQDPAKRPTNLPASSMEAWNRAQSINPTLQAANQQVAAAKAAIAEAQSAYYPEISAQLGASSGNEIDGVEGHNNDAQALLVVNYNLFNGGADLEQVDTDQALFTQAQYNMKNDQRTVKQDVSTAFDLLQKDGQRVISLKQHSTEAKKVYASYEKEFNLGHRSLFDLLNAENEYYTATVSYVDTRYDWMIDHYRLMAAMGSLNSYFSGDMQTAVMAKDAKASTTKNAAQAQQNTQMEVTATQTAQTAQPSTTATMAAAHSTTAPAITANNAQQHVAHQSTASAAMTKTASAVQSSVSTNTTMTNTAMATASQSTNQPSNKINAA